MDSFINVGTCERCGRLVAGTACVCEGIGVTVTPNVTHIWICPHCGAHCQMPGFCPTCGWVAAPPQPQWPPRSPWRCPGCGRYHAPHVDTCPWCQPHAAPVWPVWPHIGDPQPTYVGDPPWITVTASSGTMAAKGSGLQVGDPPGTVSCGSMCVEPLTGVMAS